MYIQYRTITNILPYSTFFKDIIFELQPIFYHIYIEIEFHDKYKKIQQSHSTTMQIET